MLELYHSGLTTCSKQVRLCLAEKGLDYVSHYIELWRYENLSPEYLKLNPNGVVPTLVHDGQPVINSFVINEYIEDVFTDPPLRPAEARARARMRLWTWTADEVHHAVTIPSYTAFIERHAAALSAAEAETVLARTPVPERRERWRRVTSGGYSDGEIEDAYARIGFVLGQVEDALADGPWLAGEAYTLADISMLAIVHRARELRRALLDPATRPRTNDWLDRMMARPAVIRVYAFPSDEAPRRPDGISLAGIG